MANSSTVTKVLQVSEEAAPPVHIPVMVGNELFILTQQDVRRVEDTRHMFYNRLTPNHFASGAFGNPSPQSAPAGQICTLQNLLSHCQQDCPMNCEAAQQTEEPRTIVANISKQLEWSKRCNSSSPYPINYSVATSTSGLPAQKSDYSIKQREKPKKHCSCQTSPETISKACNTEPIKKPKVFQKQSSNDSLPESSCKSKQDRCEHSQDKPCQTTPSIADDRPQSQEKKTVVPPCVVNEEYDDQQEHKR